MDCGRDFTHVHVVGDGKKTIVAGLAVTHGQNFMSKMCTLPDSPCEGANEFGCLEDVEPYKYGPILVTRCPMRLKVMYSNAFQLGSQILNVLDYISLELVDPTPRTIDAVQAVHTFREWWRGEETKRRMEESRRKARRK